MKNQPRVKHGYYQEPVIKCYRGNSTDEDPNYDTVTEDNEVGRAMQFNDEDYEVVICDK